MSITAIGLAASVVLCAVAPVSSGVWPPWAEEEVREPVYPDVTVTVEWLAERLDEHGGVVLDARARESYLTGHIPGARSLPADSIADPLVASKAFAALGLTGRERIVCCGDSSYASDAARLFWLLELSGAQRVAILVGGVRAWVGAGESVERTEDPITSVTWTANPDPDRLATTGHVRGAYGEPGVEIVDARGWGAWEGPVEHRRGTPPARVGHIPHALPFDFREFLVPRDRFMGPQDTRGVLSAFGPRPGTHVDLWGEFIIHDDGLSWHGAIGYFLLRRAGVENVRYYPEGWKSWASDAGLPVVRIVHAEELERRLAAERRWFRPKAPPPSFAVFDVRHRMDYERGHIPGAVNLTSGFFADSLNVVLERYWPDLDRSEAPIVTYCYGPTCIRSRNCSTTAARAGFANVERLYGGLEEWSAGGRPIAH